MAAENSGADAPLKLLSLGMPLTLLTSDRKQSFLNSLADGGGIRGISTLIILKHLMKRINPMNPPKPCDYFDLIGGTSTGGYVPKPDP